MKIFAEISRILPMAILLVFAMLAQSMATQMPAHADSSISANYNGAFVICSNGSLQEVTTTTSNQGKTGDMPRFVHCLDCLAVQLFTLPPHPIGTILDQDFKDEVRKPIKVSLLVESKMPEHPNRLDPPLPVQN